MTYLRAGRGNEVIYHCSPEELKELRAKRQVYRLVGTYTGPDGKVCGYDVALMPDPAPLPRAG